MGSEKDRPDVATGEDNRQPTPRDPEEMTDRELEDVNGGLASVPNVTKKPTPGGPVPIPYPNST